MKLFKESGGKYDRAFGDGGFQKKATPSYTPGQFAGVGKSVVPAHVKTTAPDMSPVVTPKAKPLAVTKLSHEEEDELTADEDGEVLVDSPPIETNKSSVKDIMLKYEATLRDASSGGSESDEQISPRRGDIKSPTLHGNVENRIKWLSGVSSTNIKKNGEVDETPGGTVAERMKAYLATAGEAGAVAVEPEVAKPPLAEDRPVVNVPRASLETAPSLPEERVNG